MADMKLANVYNSDEELQQQILEQGGGGGGGGGDVDKAYVDEKDAEERQRAMTKENQLDEKINNEITRATTEENNIKRDKQDKLESGSDLSNVSDSTKISFVDLATKIITNFTLATLWNWIVSKLINNYIVKSTTTTNVKYGDTNWGNMNWTRIKTKIDKTNFHYHWFGYIKKTNFMFSNWGGWGQLFLSSKISIELPNSNMLGKCIGQGVIKGQTAMMSESFNDTNSKFDFYFIRGTQIGTSSEVDIEIKVNCDYIGT